MQHARDDGAVHSARHRDCDRSLRHTPAPAFSDARHDSTTASISASTCSARIRAPQRKPHARPRLLARQPDRHQHVRRLGRAARTRRAARYRESLQVERDQQRLAVDPVETHVGGVGDARRARAVHMRVRQRGRECPAPADRASALAAPLPRRRLRSIHCAARPKPDRARDILRARAQLALVTARRTSAARASFPCERRARRRPWARKSCAPLIEYRSTPSSLHVHRNLARRLHAVGVEQRPRPRARSARSPRIGWITPSSLFTCITLIDLRVGPNAPRGSRPGSTMPRPSTGTNVAERQLRRGSQARPDVRRSW